MSMTGHAIEIEGCFELENRNITAQKHAGIPGITSNSLANLGLTHDVLWTNRSTVFGDSRHRRWAHWSNGPVAFPFSCTALLALLVRLLRLETSVKGPWVMSAHHFQLWNEEGPIYTSECLSSIHVFSLANCMLQLYQNDEQNVSSMNCNARSWLQNPSEKYESKWESSPNKGWKSKILYVKPPPFPNGMYPPSSIDRCSLATPPLPTPVALPHATQRRPWETPGKPTEVVFQVKSIYRRQTYGPNSGREEFSIFVWGQISSGFD